MQNFWKINPFGKLRIKAEQGRSINKEKILLLLIILLGAFFRFYNLNWDQGCHLHPDERAIVMFTTALEWPTNMSEFFSPQSSWNPHFFAYGNFPLYLLKIAGSITGNFDPSFSAYDKINLVGRFMSGIFDIATIFVIFFLGKKLFGKKVGIIASFFYTISVFPIQASHFYAVDVLLTFFILLTLYQLLGFYEKPSLKNSLLVGICFGASLATKISAAPLLVAITATIVIDFLLLVVKQPHKPHIWFPHVPRFLKRFISDGVIILSSTAIIFAILQPYAIIDFNAFWRQNMEQSQMTRDAFTFPYTLQYVGKIPYLYELKNIFFWGQGPLLATLSFAGALYFIFVLIRPHLRGEIASQSNVAHLGGKLLKQGNKIRWGQMFIIATFFWIYFFVVGKFAVGWMRYMLPLYPLLCLFSAVLIYKLYQILETKINSRFILNILYLIFYTSILVWPLSFMHIYTQPHSRILASEWMIKNIPPNSIIGTESWDDTLPVYPNTFQFLELPMNEREDATYKWPKINEILNKSDYIVISSNRNYASLQKLTNCSILPQDRCYAETAQFYKKFFDQKLGFIKIAEFTSNPTIPFLSIKINDQRADESFTVYDHPKVMIFKNETR